MTDSDAKLSGFSLIEVAVVMVIVIVVSALLAPLLAGLVDVDRSQDAFDDARRAYIGITGNPKIGTFGYLGDVGTNPSSILDLIRDPGVTGWSGPYLTGVSVENNLVLDSFGSPLEFFYRGDSAAVTDYLAIISRGPDRGSTNTSAAPNNWSGFAGTLPLSSVGAANYAVVGANPDNIVFPRFTDRFGLLSYQNAGLVNINIQTYDYNSNVVNYTAACPNLYSVRVTSVKRPADTFTVPYTPSGGSFDLIQGSYRMQVHASTSGHVFWDQIVTVSPGTSQNFTVYAPGADSNSTPNYSLSVNNVSGSTVNIYNFFTTIGAAVATGTTGGPYTVKGCSQVTVRSATATNRSVLDSFIMPIDLPTYTRVLNTATTTHTVTNRTGTYKYLFVYINNLLVGQVSGLGNRKTKVFRNIKTNERFHIFDQDGVLRSSGAAGGVTNL